MNIYPSIENLLYYAQENLFLDSLDVIYARNRIMSKLGLTDYEVYEVDEEAIAALTEPSSLIAPLVTYAKLKQLISDDQSNAFADEIMNILCIRPSEVADMFGDLVDHNGNRAVEWIADYSIKSGYVKRDKMRHYEAKGTRGKIEVSYMSECGCKSSGKSNYPLCSVCEETVGFGEDLLKRVAPLNLGAEEWILQFVRNPLFDKQGVVANASHVESKMGTQIIERMFDFVDKVGNCFTLYSQQCCMQAHAHFKVGGKLLPLHKANDEHKIKSATYPYVNMTVVDWYDTVVRMNCTNREKLAECALEMINAWNASQGHKAIIGVRKSTGKYIVEIVLLDGKSPKAEHALFGSVNPFAHFGAFKLGQSDLADVQTMEKYLTKEDRFVPGISGMDKYQKLITALTKDVGNDKLSAVEAELDVREVVNRTLEQELTDLKVADADLEALFASINIK